VAWDGNNKGCYSNYCENNENDSSDLQSAGGGRTSPYDRCSSSASGWSLKNKTRNFLKEMRQHLPVPPHGVESLQTVGRDGQQQPAAGQQRSEQQLKFDLLCAYSD
jgi:hypothetical protein